MGLGHPRPGTSSYARMQMLKDAQHDNSKDRWHTLSERPDERLRALIYLSEMPLLTDAELEAFRRRLEQKEQSAPVRAADVWRYLTEEYAWFHQRPVVTNSTWESYGPEGGFVAGGGVLALLSALRRPHPITVGLGVLFGGSLGIACYHLALQYEDPNCFRLRYRDNAYWERGPLYNRTTE